MLETPCIGYIPTNRVSIPPSSDTSINESCHPVLFVAVPILFNILPDPPVYLKTHSMVILVLITPEILGLTP
jgi:hypothetical protein